jgi:2-iminobutanoate/2-iminopropanoate deaminase
VEDRMLVIENGPQPLNSYPHARIYDGMVYVTCQAGRDPVTGVVVEGGFEPQLRQAIDNVETILVAAGSAMNKVLRTTVIFLDEADLPALNRIYDERFQAPFPARTSFRAAGLWGKAVVGIDAVAALS